MNQVKRVVGVKDVTYKDKKTDAIKDATILYLMREMSEDEEGRGIETEDLFLDRSIYEEAFGQSDPLDAKVIVLRNKGGYVESVLTVDSLLADAT